ncbi:MAG TPA: WD40 repeat domain-containing protein [Arachnia sp.]|nr:WD40 repeat domain-containing protein [Arachnia sp.]HMR13841.1 WD40 repeat domain-containing protein [Arachnia sp.]
MRVSSGRQLALLNGFDGALETLAWDDEVTLAGSFGTTQARWSLPWSPALADLDWRVMDLVAGPGDVVLAVGDGGQLALVDETGARELPVLPGGVGRTIDLGACDPSALVRGSAGEVHVACMLGDVLDVDLASGRVVPSPVRDFQVVGLVVDPDGSLLATSVRSELFARVGSGWSMVGQWPDNCYLGASVVVPSPGGDRILMTGASVAGLCTHLRNDPADRARQTRLVPPSTIQSFRDAAWSPDGRSFVAAAASGELWVFDAEDYVTRALPVPTGAGLRSVVFVDPQHVLVGSDDGELVIVDVSVAVMDLPGQLKEARKRIERAEAAGIG